MKLYKNGSKTLISQDSTIPEKVHPFLSFLPNPIKKNHDLKKLIDSSEQTGSKKTIVYLENENNEPTIEDHLSTSESDSKIQKNFAYPIASNRNN